MIIEYLTLFLLIGLSLTKDIDQKMRSINIFDEDSLSMDKAYFILQNENYSDNLYLFANQVECEECDFEQILLAGPKENATTVIPTQYPYDLEVRSFPSNNSVLCAFTSYSFDEHGTYLLSFEQNTSMTNQCSIRQIGNPSNYSGPVILAIFFFVLYVILVQFYRQIQRRGYLRNVYRRLRPEPLLINGNPNAASILVDENNREESSNDHPLQSRTTGDNAPSVTPSRRSNDKKGTGQSLPRRLRGLDTFRGFSLMVMIFVNYGGGGYWFFDHSTWNGLTLADLVFPWFVWMMGVSIVLSQRSLRSKNVSKGKILWKITRRMITLFFLAYIEEHNPASITNLRILGVLQRLAICYFLTAMIVLLLEKKEDSTAVPQSNILKKSIGKEIYQNVFQYWLQWSVVIIIVIVWLLITFVLPVPNCPTGYLGPGGKHRHGQYFNCTGGAAGYVDRVILGASHLYGSPTCKEIYQTDIPYDPEGIMGNLTGVLLCYLGVQAAHIFIHSTRANRVCVHWIVWGLICGSLGLILSGGGHSHSWIPINKNLWSLTFVLILSSLAFFNLTILYLLVDVYQWFTGEPFLWLGMNSIVIYVCHGIFQGKFLVGFPGKDRHADQIANNLYGAFFWSVVAGVMYWKKIYIAI